MTVREKGMRLIKNKNTQSCFLNKTKKDIKQKCTHKYYV